MRTRRLKPEETDVVLEWFTHRGWTVAPPKNMLSQLGLVVTDDDDKLLCCGWIYLTNSPVVYLEWVATNPETTGILSLKALKCLVEWVKNFVRQSDSAELVMQFLPSEKLARFYKTKLGFTGGEKAELVVWGE